MRWTELTLTPPHSAGAAAVQCVVAPSGAARVAATMRASTGNALRSGSVVRHPGDPAAQESILPSPYRGLGDVGAAHDFHRAAAIRSEQHDPRPPDLLLRTVVVSHDRRQKLAVDARYLDGDACAHPADSHAQVSSGISNRTQTLNFIHRHEGRHPD
jgi:hypothetical protein